MPNQTGAWSSSPACQLRSNHSTYASMDNRHLMIMMMTSGFWTVFIYQIPSTIYWSVQDSCTSRYEELHPNTKEIPVETAEKDPSFADTSVKSDTTQTDKIENKDSLEKGANEETAEEFPSYSEWTKKVLAEEKNKQDDQGQTSSNLPQKQKMRNNYASADCGAKVVLANPEAENIKYILNSNPDEYMINPCQSKKWFIVELCESIQIKNIETASLELFSSRPKTFRISVSDRYPIKEWQLLGTFESTEERTIHKYQITEENYSKFVKVDILDHYGEEHFCPLTLFRVFGFTIEEDMESDVNQHDDLDDDVQDEPPVNLFASAKDTVLRLVKHVLTTGNEQATKENADGSHTGHPEENKSNATSQKIKTPNVTIPCQENCLNGTQKNATNTTSTNSTQLPCVPQAVPLIGSTGTLDIVSDGVPTTACDIKVNASTTTKAIEPSAASEQIQPSMPEGSVSQVPESPVQSPSEKLVTILNDDEQVPISDTASNEPMVQLIESEEQHHPAVLSSYITCCLICPLKKTSTKYSSSRSLKCQFLKRVSAIATSSKKDSISWKVPLISKIVEEPSAAHTSDTDLFTKSILHSADSKSDQNIVTLETETSSSHSTKTANLTVSEPTASLYPSSEVHTALESEKTILTDQKSSESSVVAQVISKAEHSEFESVSSLPKEEVNETSSFVSDIPSTEQKTASSKMASSGGEPVDFRTPATTLYIEPSSTSVKQVELNGVTSEHYDSHLSPSDLLFAKSESTATLLDKQDVTLGIKSDDKAKLKETESNIITTASLPKSGEEMEPTGANIVPTRVSESPSKAVVPESSSISISSMTAEDKVVKAVNITDPKVDSKGRPLYTLVRVGLPPAGKRESAIMRLNNRIKALELNVSLSSRFLDELSQRYRKQSEEMMHFLNKTVARLGNVTKKTQETVQKHEIHLTILESRLDNLTLAVSQLTENMDNLTRQLTDRQVLWASIEVFILALIFVVCLRKRQPSLPPNLVAKVLDDLLQTQHFSPNRRRNSESNIKQSSVSHCEVVRQKSADDLKQEILFNSTTFVVYLQVGNDIISLDDYRIFRKIS
uniref:SUN domain-containing protein n=1 Tax=Octopus bimaculoides TaxID=37653 RepID=A0A0L8HD13_OCTBM